MSEQYAPAVTAPAVGGSERRALVLRILRSNRSPMAITDLSERVGLHPNTIRFHLEGLEVEGLVQRSTEPTSSPGRPRVLYEATAEGVRSGPREYAGLAAILADALAASAENPARAAQEAGHNWGRTLTGGTAAARSGAAAMRQLADILGAMGFEPEAVPARRPTEVRINNCPFRGVVGRHPQIICALHLGLMQGVLEGARDGLTVDDLQPDAEVGLCLAHLARPGLPGRSATGR